MKYKFINVLMFTVGAAIGSAVTWKVVKTKYERIAQEEIDSVKEAFRNRLDKLQEQVANLQEQVDDYCTEDEAEEYESRAGKIDWSRLEDLDETEEDMNEYAMLASVYTADEEDEQKGGAESMSDKIRVISPYDFGEHDDFERVSLTYYADGTLEDEDYNIITDIDNLVGEKSLTTFGDYEEDSVFVRNYYLRTDFEILKDYRTYEEARSVGPGSVDDE